MDAQVWEEIRALKTRLLRVEAKLGLLPDGMSAAEICDAKGVRGPGVQVGGRSGSWTDPSQSCAGSGPSGRRGTAR
jgi:hypothetical protein